MANSIRADIGTTISVDMKESMVGATSLSFDVEKPKGSRATWTPTISGNFLEYVTIAGDLNESGEYKLSPKFTLSGSTKRGAGVTFTVVDKYT